MRLGLHIVRFDWPDAPSSIGPGLAAVGAAAEEAGISALSVMDHWFQVDALAPVTDPMLEGYTTLGYLAGHTSKIRLRMLVTGVTYRHPGLLAKTVSTLDVLSGGRAELGIGAAWYEREHAGLGVPYPPVGERFERLEETLQTCLQMWSDDNGPFRGKHYQLAETICSPQPITRPHPPILIGGNGERKTLRLVARYGDACNLMAASPDDVAAKLDVLRAHCDHEQRDFGTIAKTIVTISDPFADLDRFLADCDRYAALGVDEMIVMADNEPVRYVGQIAERLIPRLATR
jgi:F420-dependent oxidoreductase-like protein